MDLDDVKIDDRGTGRPLLLLHGGAGPGSLLPFGARLAARGVRAVTPTHPGFSGTPRPEQLRTPADLADLYVRLLDDLDLRDVFVVGFSIGGWIASEVALRGAPRIGRVAVVDGMGIEVTGHPIADVSSLRPPELAALSYHDPGSAPDPATFTDAGRTAMAANLATVVSYGSPTDASSCSSAPGTSRSSSSPRRSRTSSSPSPGKQPPAAWAGAGAGVRFVTPGRSTDKHTGRLRSGLLADAGSATGAPDARVRCDAGHALAGSTLIA